MYSDSDIFQEPIGEPGGREPRGTNDLGELG